ncbi:MAG: hypothetical protein ACKV2T_20075 [Kofleriaceae bacterium]
MRVYALLVIAACSNAPDWSPPSTSPLPSPTTAQHAVDDPWANTRFVDDPWADTRVDQVPSASSPPRFAMPLLDGPARSELVVDSTPGQRVAAISDSIELLAVTEDGSAAITSDVGHSVRLWPTLDGKREPLVVSLTAPSSLAIARDGDAFVVGTVDAIGQLQIVTLTNTAEVTRRLDVALSRPVVAIHATTSGFVALRDDRVVTILDLAGAVQAELASDPGEYVASIAVQGDRALAFVESEDVVRGRWIDLASATWGSSTVALPFRTGDGIALSPDLERVAGLRKRGVAIVVATLSSGKVVATYGDISTDTRVIGFRGRSLVIGSVERTWLADDPQSDLFSMPFAFARGKLLGGHGSSIAVYASDATTYVGYRMSLVTQMHATQSGFSASDGASVVALDRQFRTRAAFDVAHTSPHLTQITLVDGEHALGTSYQQNRGLYLISTTQKTTTLVATLVHTFELEPTTRLLRYHREGYDYLARFDPKTAAFGPAVEFAKSVTLVLLDPTHANGDEVAVISPRSIYSSHDVVYGRLEGDVFVKTREKTIEPSEAWIEEGNDLRTLVRKDLIRTTSPDGAHTATMRNGRLELREGKTTRWRVPSSGVHGVVWSSNGDLAAYGNGIAKIDLATGALLDRQCGAWFGRWDAPPTGHGPGTLCEVP